MIESKLVKEAAEFAAYAHRGTLYGKQPYFFHLAAVVGVLVEFGVDDERLLAAGWLHDVVEDTEWTTDSLKSTFGKPISSIVWACTGVGANRKSRNADIARKIRQEPDAGAVKAADRIANIRNCRHTANRALLEMYRKEYAAFAELLVDSVEQARDELQPPIRRMMSELDALLEIEPVDSGAS